MQTHGITLRIITADGYKRINTKMFYDFDHMRCEICRWVILHRWVIRVLKKFWHFTPANPAWIHA